ncbi:hypothetical protein HOLDEFILI_03824 [Holdemania filiformis DSM 12042]|uniref:Uncharacterized protein n=1 Tax=Holdemania filiformis DSM 12042 TaxID=545696 RepID=B9YDA8_9FIRM|nr:hypothetical protein HOLDEFILI_03824 [Holdemania filiformis DSM 12042]
MCTAYFSKIYKKKWKSLCLPFSINQYKDFAMSSAVRNPVALNRAPGPAMINLSVCLILCGRTFYKTVKSYTSEIKLLKVIC